MGIPGSDSLEVPTIYKAYIRPKFQGISLENMPLYSTVPPFQDPEIPIEQCLTFEAPWTWTQSYATNNFVFEEFQGCTVMYLPAIKHGNRELPSMDVYGLFSD